MLEKRNHCITLPDKEGDLQILAGVDDGVVALVDYSHVGDITDIVGGGGRVHNVRIPHLELSHLTRHGHIELPGDGRTRQPGLVKVELANIALKSLIL